MQLLSLSTGSLSHLFSSEYHDFEAIQSAMVLLHAHAEVDGFEFQKIAEWDSVGPPRDAYRAGRPTEFRTRAWESCSKYTTAEIGRSIKAAGLPILSVHANRDVGICLCTRCEDDVDRGSELIYETLSLCSILESKVAVFHFWDSMAKTIDTAFLRETMDSIQQVHPTIKATIENIPTSVDGLTPLELAKKFDSLTLDTRWACMYDELKGFAEVLPRIANVHLRARLLDQEWIFDSPDWTLEEVIDLIRHTWGYSGLITVEPEGGYHASAIEDIVVATKALRILLGYPRPRPSSRRFHHQ